MLLFPSAEFTTGVHMSLPLSPCEILRFICRVSQLGHHRGLPAAFRAQIRPIHQLHAFGRAHILGLSRSPEPSDLDPASTQEPFQCSVVSFTSSKCLGMSLSQPQLQS